MIYLKLRKNTLLYEVAKPLKNKVNRGLNSQQYLLTFEAYAGIRATL